MANPLLASMLAQLQQNQHSMGTPISIANTSNSQVIGTLSQDVIFFLIQVHVYWCQRLVARDHSVIHAARSPKSSVLLLIIN